MNSCFTETAPIGIVQTGMSWGIARPQLVLIRSIKAILTEQQQQQQPEITKHTGRIIQTEVKSMTNELYSRFQRTLGVIEGISLGLNNEIGNALLEQCDVLDSIIELTQRYDGKDDRGGKDDVERS